MTMSRAGELYLDLLKKVLRRDGFEPQYHMIEPAAGSLAGTVYGPVRKLLASRNLTLVQSVSAQTRELGEYWPSSAETMLGSARLDNVQQCATTVLEDGVPGDFLEAGVWRGGAVILMRAVLEAYGDPDRVVWAADSFEGLPKPDDASYPADAGDTHWQWDQLAVSEEQVRENFERYGLLDDRVRFLKGWFSDTLGDAPVDRLALLRVDGDMYGSTMDVLRPLYPKLSPGGFLIVDDYGDPNLAGCKQAVDDYRAEHGIADEIVPIDNMGIYWRKSG
jgi:O-methyltransferase